MSFSSLKENLNRVDIDYITKETKVFQLFRSLTSLLIFCLILIENVNL